MNQACLVERQQIKRNFLAIFGHFLAIFWPFLVIFYLFSSFFSLFFKFSTIFKWLDRFFQKFAWGQTFMKASFMQISGILKAFLGVLSAKNQNYFFNFFFFFFGFLFFHFFQGFRVQIWVSEGQAIAQVARLSPCLSLRGLICPYLTCQSCLLSHPFHMASCILLSNLASIGNSLLDSQGTSSN